MFRLFEQIKKLGSISGGGKKAGEEEEEEDDEAKNDKQVVYEFFLASPFPPLEITVR